MKTFDIYIPAKFYWTRTRIIYAIITMLILAYVAVKYLFVIPKGEPIYTWLGYAIFATLALGFISAVLGIPKIKPIAGKLKGVIRFQEEGIYLAEMFYPIESIKEIEFHGVDWQGLFQYAVFSDYFDNRLSNGSGNKLMMGMTDGEKIITRFIKIYACELADLKPIFLSYYMKDKIGYLELVDNICISDPEEQAELKKMKSVGLRVEEELKRHNY
ncbi:hypothetical protein [Olivibacter jilunii]|uniref:hypothetical protein n=1 Tax=Olivibacter jilunii TaxID=985016 RepID=UPI003F13B6AB